MERTRRTFSSEEKLKMVMAVIHDGKAVSDIAQESSVHPNLILKWKKEFLENAVSVFDRHRPDITEKAQQQKIEALEAKLRDNETNADSINTVLITAQKLADSIVSEAKAKAEETVETANNDAENIKQRTKKALEEIDAVITAQKNEAAKEAEAMLKDAARKSEGMILAAKDSVAREQLLFDKLKGEVAAEATGSEGTREQQTEPLL